MSWFGKGPVYRRIKKECFFGVNGGATLHIVTVKYGTYILLEEEDNTVSIASSEVLLIWARSVAVLPKKVICVYKTRGSVKYMQLDSMTGAPA